jgi:hypothetical protein
MIDIDQQRVVYLCAQSHSLILQAARSWTYVETSLNAYPDDKLH